MKRVKGLLILLICVFLLSGCVKETISMDIKSDKSMTLSGKVLVKEEFKEDFDETYNSEDLTKAGFKVTTVTEDGYSGYLITKEFKNIDDLSKNNNIQIDISGIFQDKVDFNKLFTKTSDFFKDTYKALFLFASNTEEEETESNLDSDALVEEGNDSLYTDDDETETTETQIEGLDDLANTLTAGMEFKYVVTLPVKPKSHNASTVSEDGKTLTWNLATSEASNIQYEFSLLNMTHIYMIAGGAAGVLLVIVVIALLIIKKGKASKETLIHKEYDPSIAGQVTGEGNAPVVGAPAEEAPVLPEMAGPQVVENLEYTLPEEETKNQVEEVPQAPQFNVQQEPQMAPQYTVPQEPQMAPQYGPSPEMQYGPAPEVQPAPMQAPGPVNLYNNDRPDFVKDTEPKAFVHDDIPQTHTPLPSLNQGMDMNLDVPDATALSDMNN